jgi:hypothetical protein
MSEVFKGQILTLSLDTDVTLTGAADPRILYEKPNGDTGFWVATISLDTLSYTLVAGNINVPGVWTFQAYAVLSGAVKYGQKVTLEFRTPIL